MSISRCFWSASLHCRRICNSGQICMSGAPPLPAKISKATVVRRKIIRWPATEIIFGRWTSNPLLPRPPKAFPVALSFANTPRACVHGYNTVVQIKKEELQRSTTEESQKMQSAKIESTAPSCCGKGRCKTLWHVSSKRAF